MVYYHRDIQWYKQAMLNTVDKLYKHNVEQKKPDAE